MALFAVHPVESETVVWVAERKNVLSMALALGSMLSYFRFAPPNADEKPTATNHGARWYALAFGLYVLALFSKTAVVALPAVLVVLYWWKRGRLTRQDVVWLLPFFTAGLALALVTVWVETHHVGAKATCGSCLSVRACCSPAEHYGSTSASSCGPSRSCSFIRAGRSIHTPGGSTCFRLPPSALCRAMVGTRASGTRAIGGAADLRRCARAGAGVLQYLLRQFAQVADHFQYYASAAILASRRPAPRRFLARGQQVFVGRYIGAAVLLVALMGLTHERSHFYETAEGFYRGLLAENPTVWCVPQNLGAILHRQGKYEEALSLYRQAIAMNPADTMLYDGAGTILIDWGHRDGIRPERLSQAIDCFREACRLEPQFPGKAKSGNRCSRMPSNTARRGGSSRPRSKSTRKMPRLT